MIVIMDFNCIMYLLSCQLFVQDDDDSQRGHQLTVRFSALSWNC